MKSFILFSLLIVHAAGAEAQLPKNFKIGELGLWRATTYESDGSTNVIETCITAKMREDMAKYKPKTCTTVFLKDTPLEAISEVRCKDPSEGGKLTTISQIWLPDGTLRTIINQEGVVSKHEMKRISDCK